MKKPTWSRLKKNADTPFSKYIRLKDADKFGRVACYTCKKVYHWKEMDCGHFHNRRHLGTRWDEMNCKPQCTTCNSYNEGEKALFAEALVKEYGVEVLEELRMKRNTTKEIGRAEVEEIIDYYKRQLKVMETLKEGL